MKKIFGWLTSNVLLAFMYFAVALSIIMLVLYFAVFHKELSNNDDSWANFGSYFASITGLLAFTGVLYTAWQSAQRANKAEKRTEQAEQNAKEEFKLREERDLFFKLLDLYKRQVDSFSSENTSGAIEFRNYGMKSNTYLRLYVALEGFRDNKNGFDDSNNFFSAMISYFNGSPQLGFGNIYDFINYHLSDGNITKILSYYTDAKKYADYLMKSMTIEEINQKMKVVADIIYNEDGHLLGQYYRTIFYLLHLTSGFKQKNEYFKIFRSQLSRYELLMLLYNSVSSQSTLEVLSLYKECEIFNNIETEDVLGCNYYSDTTNKNVGVFISNLLKEYEKFQSEKN